MLGNDALPEQQRTEPENARQQRAWSRSDPLLSLSSSLVARVRALVSKERFEHIERVVELASAIAKANGFSSADQRRVVLAALLHDAARDLPDERMLELVNPSNEVEADHPLVLHGRAARLLAERWGIDDEVVLGAIEGHVFGVALDDRVGMALYVADVSEPARGVNDDVRQLAMSDLPAAYRLAVTAKVDYLAAEGIPIHPATLRAYRSLRGRDEPIPGSDSEMP